MERFVTCVWPCQWTPHANAPPPLSKEEACPPEIFFTKSHTNCPFLPSFLSVQWHVMGTILGIMCLFFQYRFSFFETFQVPYGAA